MIWVSDHFFGKAVEEIPVKIGHFGVDNFDPTEMKLKLKNHDILITPEIVHELLGVHLGGKDLHGLNKVERQDPISVRWYDQFNNRYPTPKKVVDIIMKTLKWMGFCSN